MSNLPAVIAQVRDECEEDFVGIWVVHRLLTDEAERVTAKDDILRVVDALLTGGQVTIGEFANGTFREWPGDTGTRLDRLRLELEKLGRPPDIGEVGWLARR
jgi:hypothetical protein